jgi:hypothetical protein
MHFAASSMCAVLRLESSHCVLRIKVGMWLSAEANSYTHIFSTISSTVLTLCTICFNIK